jgi:His-Xaa-Ser system radical SAM maturase HxsB
MYTLLPFRFARKQSYFLLTNDAGEYYFLSPENFHKFINLEIDSHSELFENLKSKFFLTNTSIEDAAEVLSIRYRTKKAFILEGVTLHIIVPTIRCNSKCIYCQVSSKNNVSKSSSTDMDFTTARKTVDLIFQSPAKYLKLEFQGGEPTLNFDIVKFIVRYANLKSKTTRKKVDYVICTNLINIKAPTLNFLKKHNVYISTSLDGPKDIHCKNRPAFEDFSSYEKVIQNIKRARNHIGDNHVSALLTVTGNNLWDLHKVIDEYISQGFNSIFLRPLNPFGRAIKNNINDYSPEQFMECYLNCLDYILELNMTRAK